MNKLFIILFFSAGLHAKTEISLSKYLSAQYWDYSTDRWVNLEDVGAVIKVHGNRVGWGLKARRMVLESDYEYRQSEYSGYASYVVKDRYYGRLDYCYQDNLGQHSFGLDAGYVFCNWFNASLGYVGAYVDQLDNMLSIKTNWPLTKALTLKYHIRSDLGVSGQRDYEWWAQAEYKIPLDKLDLLLWKIDRAFFIRYQLDHEFGHTEKEFEVSFSFLTR